MDELQAKLNRRLSRIDAMKAGGRSSEGPGDGEGDGGEAAAIREILDIRTADRETLLELINICSASLPPGVFSEIVAKHADGADAASSQS